MQPFPYTQTKLCQCPNCHEGLYSDEGWCVECVCGLKTIVTEITSHDGEIIASLLPVSSFHGMQGWHNVKARCG